MLLKLCLISTVLQTMPWCKKQPRASECSYRYPHTYCDVVFLTANLVSVCHVLYTTKQSRLHVSSHILLKTAS